MLVVLSSLVLLTNISGQSLSNDEPETIAVARGIGLYGVPTAWDGRNLQLISSVEAYKLIHGIYVWKWHPWVQHYLAFSALQVFGNPLTLARLPFAMVGVGTILLLYVLAVTYFRNQRLAILLSLNLLFLLPFFLYVRQVRYYSPTIFFSLAIFCLFIRPNKWTPILMTLCGVALFNTNYESWFSTFILMVPLLALKKQWSLVGIWLLQLGGAVGWYLYFHPYGGNLLLANAQPLALVRHSLSYLNYVHKYLFNFLLIPFVFLGKAASRKPPLLLLIIWIVEKIVLVTIFFTPHGRYLIEIFPLVILVLGYVYYFLRRTPVLMYGLFALLLVPNLGKYQIEWQGKYPDLPSQIGNYLKSQARAGDLFWANDGETEIYLYSGIPNFVTYCIGPNLNRDPDRIRWFIFFQNDKRLPESLNSISCLGTIWQHNLEKNYHLVRLTYLSNTVLKNDVDIVNRDFPPQSVPDNQVLIYEKN